MAWYDYTPKKTLLEQFDDRLEELYFRDLISINRFNDEDIKKKNEEARSYMPVYTDDELEELDDEVEEDNYYDDVDYDEYDKYYDED